MITLQTTPAQLPEGAEKLMSLGFFILLLVALYFAFKYFNKKDKLWTLFKLARLFECINGCF